jgi:Cu/Ag efflux protein CusF
MTDQSKQRPITRTTHSGATRRPSALSFGLRGALLLAGLVSLAASAAEGEIRKIDVAQSKVTIKSGPMPSLDLPAMTLVFKAKPAGLLSGYSEGDLVSFEAEKIDGQYTLVAIKKR